jgi:hypothetical protein
MRYPSVKTLRALEDTVDEDVTALRIRKVLDGRTPLTRENGFLGGDMKLAKLCTIDKLLGNHGVEFVRFECARHEGTYEGFEFSNTGDSYATTLILYEGKFYVTGWADMLEWHEKRCKDCRERR